MNKESDKIDLINHSISIVERHNVTITGIIKIDSFDNEEFLLETSLGLLGIKGRDLEIIKLDTYEGTITIKGVIDGFTYLDSTKTKKEDSVITRLFK